MTIYAYCRVSTQRQADDGESLGVQRRMCEGYAMSKALDVPTLFSEHGVSGSIPIGDRPQGNALLAILKPGDVIITTKLDRMFRSALDALKTLEGLKEKSIKLHIIDLGGDVTGDGISKLVLTILSAVAEAERDRIRERIRDVKHDQKKRQRYLGGNVPFGFTRGDDGELILDPAQHATIDAMVKARADGMTLREIAAGIGGISHVAVSKILSRHLHK